jgi:hypothetical protein
MKRCAKCGESKSPVDGFYKDKSTGDGLTYYCKDCCKAKTRAWMAANPEKVKARAKARDYWKSNIKRKYGITPEQYDEMLNQQNGLCAVCDKPERIRDGRRMPVDHDHETGKVRGLLCSHCNRGIGLFGDDPDVLLSAAAYLIRAQETSHANPQTTK